MTVPGQKSGTSWDALLIVTGHDTVKADRMLRRFGADAIGTTETKVSAERAHELVVAAAARLGVTACERRDLRCKSGPADLGSALRRGDCSAGAQDARDGSGSS